MERESDHAAKGVKRSAEIDYRRRSVHITHMQQAADAELIVNAMWDAEASVWVATSDDVLGLVTEAASFELLLEKLRVMVPELLEMNHAMPSSGKASYRVTSPEVNAETRQVKQNANGGALWRKLTAFANGPAQKGT